MAIRRKGTIVNTENDGVLLVHVVCRRPVSLDFSCTENARKSERRRERGLQEHVSATDRGGSNIGLLRRAVDDHEGVAVNSHCPY